MVDKSPVEKIIEIFNNLLNAIQDEKFIKQLQYAIEIITSNKLYEPLLEENQKEIKQWMEQYCDKNKSKQIMDDKKQSKHEDQNKKVQLLNNNLKNLKHKLQNIIAQSDELQDEKEKEFQYEQIQIPKTFQIFFEDLNSTEFMIFELHDQEKENELAYLLIHLFNFHNIYPHMKLEPQKLFDFANQISSLYYNNPYHNKIHSFDVTQTMHFFIQRCKFIELANLDPLEIGTMYITSAIHDLQHPGQTNLYQINTRSTLTILYNDQSPLENHHLSASFRILFNKNNNTNIFSELNHQQLKETRSIIINMILSTDMAFHFIDLNKLKGRLASNDFNCQMKDKQLCMNSLLHAADISNPFKPFHIYQQWTIRVLDEFWKQGDIEREQGLPISYLCDRYTTNTSKSQLGFIDFIVKPFYELISQFLVELVYYMPIFDQNKEEWQIYEEYYNKKLEELNQQKEEEKKLKLIENNKSQEQNQTQEKKNNETNQ